MPPDETRDFGEPDATLRALAASFARGDADAFARAHRRLAPGLKRLFLKRATGQGEVADELGQQTWAQVWRSVCQRRYDPNRAAISTFVYAVAHNVWLQYVRRARRDAATPEPPEQLSGVDPERALGFGELLEALRGCLHNESSPNALSPEQREIVLATAAGASERDLARRLGLSASTVHERKVAALDRVRRCLAAKGFSPDMVEHLDPEVE